MLTPADREFVARELPRLRKIYPKLLINDGIGQAFVNSPTEPKDCLVRQDVGELQRHFKTRVEPCVFGGTPDCSQCGCAISSALHWIKDIKAVGPVTIDYLVRGSMKIGTAVQKLRSQETRKVGRRGGAAGEGIASANRVSCSVGFGRPRCKRVTVIMFCCVAVRPAVLRHHFGPRIQDRRPPQPTPASAFPTSRGRMG